MAPSTAKLYWGAEGFGYRHIRVRHGWDSEDSNSTGVALRQPSAIDDNRDDRSESWRYFYYWTTSTGLQCTRRVLVDFDVDPLDDFPRDEFSKRPKNAITSFAYPRATGSSDPAPGTGL